MNIEKEELIKCKERRQKNLKEQKSIKLKIRKLQRKSMKPRAD